jgi:hypothetical protein
MGTGQMLLVLLTVVLFTSIMASTMSNLSSQLDYLIQTAIVLQGEKLAHKYINLIDVQLKSGNQTFTDIYTAYQNVAINETVDGIQALNYTVNISMQYCTDESGNTVAGAATDFLRINVWISTTFGPDTIFIGTAANPIQSVYTDPVL